MLASKPVASIGQIRSLNVHEYVSMEVMRDFKIPVPKGGMAESKEKAMDTYKDIIGGWEQNFCVLSLQSLHLFSNVQNGIFYFNLMHPVSI